jgi:hypothetical protein
MPREGLFDAFAASNKMKRSIASNLSVVQDVLLKKHALN